MKSSGKWSFPFVHIHVHTDKSFLDGVGRATEYAEMASGSKHTHLAITDHGNLYGLPDHRRACREYGLKPIYGCEVYVNDERDKGRETERERRATQQKKGDLDPTFVDNHLVLLCTDDDGWKNLLHINHDSVISGFYYRPRTTHDIVCKHAKGLLATSACLGSQFSRRILRGEIKEARALIAKFRDAFGERFVFELHFNESPEQHKVNAFLIREAKKTGVRLVVAQDVHYACRNDVDRQDEMISVARHTAIDDPKFWSLSARRLWFANPRDIWESAKGWGYDISFETFRQACANTQDIAESCNADIYPTTGLQPPRYINSLGDPESKPNATLRTMASEGLLLYIEEQKVPDSRVYMDRLYRELDAIKRCGMAHFYLVTMDVVRECRKRGIRAWVRGSGCASLVAMAVGIHEIDPIRFDLLFERFVDPNRASAPDFDIDIDSTRRPEIVEWLTLKYGGPGGERIAKISAISTFGLKAAVRDIGFARGVPDSVTWDLSSAADRVAAPVEAALADSVPSNRDERVEDVRNAILENVTKPETRKWVEANQVLLDSALVCVGRARGRTQHAAGYVVAPGPIEDFLPIDQTTDPTTKKPIVMTAWGEGQASQDIAETGLMKLDLLSLDTITVVSEIVRLASKRSGKDVSHEVRGLAFDFTDERVIKQFASGNGIGLHQLNQTDQALAQLCRQIRPTGIDDIVAAIALYRPGSMQFMDLYVRRKHGRERVESVHPIFDAITATTFGILVYQEQIMRVLHELGDIPLREAYSVIKLISKKRVKDIHAYRERFIASAKKNHGCPEETGKAIFDTVEAFGGYGFNKAHAASYAVLSWVTAYLRDRYPLEFWSCWLNVTPNEAPNKNQRVQQRRVEVFMVAARRAGFRLRPPRIGASDDKWRILKDGSILAPLSLIPGVGDRAARDTRAAFKSEKWETLYDFLAWCDDNRSAMNSAQIARAAAAGAFERFVDTQTAIETIARWKAYKPSKKNGSRTDQLLAAGVLSPRKSIGEYERMAMERKALGFSFWASPWSIADREGKVARLLASGRIVTESERNRRGMRRPFRVASVRKHIDKNGNEMGFVALESPTGANVKGVCFAREWKNSRVVADECYLVRGDFQRDGSYIIGGCKVPFRNLDGVEA